MRHDCLLAPQLESMSEGNDGAGAEQDCGTGAVTVGRVMGGTRKKAQSQRMRFGSQPDWLLPVVHCLMALRRDGAERHCYLPCTAQLAIVIRNIPALLIVPQRGIFHFAIFLLATGLERIATY